MACSSSDSLDHQSKHSHSNYDAGCVASNPKLSSITGAKTDTSSADASIRTSSSRDIDRSGELSISNGSDLESEWVEQDEPGVYITIKALPDGKRELRRVRFRLVSTFLAFLEDTNNDLKTGFKACFNNTFLDLSFKIITQACKMKYKQSLRYDKMKTRLAFCFWKLILVPT